VWILRAIPRPIVDPRNPGKPVGEKSITQLRPKTRKFGLVPDWGRCQPGDLILSCSISPDCIERGISVAQRRAGFAADNSRWTHAAVYLYEDFIAEADPWAGVRTRSLYSDVPTSLFLIRRRNSLTIEERYRIALCAQRMLGARYGLLAAFSAGLRALVSPMWNRPWFARKRRAVICSQVFYDAHATITRHFLADCEAYPLYPANLSATPDLVDVSVPWLRLT
jgi:hypothetical protein